MPPEQKLYTKALLEEIEGEKLFVASSEVIDREGETLAIDGWDLVDFKKNPVLQWAHIPFEPTIGRAKKIFFKTIDGVKKLVFEPEFHRKSNLSNLLADLVEEDYIKAVSVGFLPIEFDPDEKKYTKQSLLEISFVNVPANQDALALAYSKGFNKDDIRKIFDGVNDKDLEILSEGKPYPNEHACRLRNPADFDKDSFRRTQRKHDGKVYSVIMGKLKGEDSMTEQAYRYAKDTWRADDARTHCQKHGGSFHEAKKELEKLELIKVNINEIKETLDGVVEGIKYLTKPTIKDIRSNKEGDKTKVSRRRTLQAIHKLAESLIIEDKKNE